MEILIPEFKIERRVRAMAHRISEEHKASGDSLPPVMICVLNGGFMFFTEPRGKKCQIKVCQKWICEVQL